MAQTIAESVTKLTKALTDDKNALTEKKVTVPATTKHSDVAGLIAQVTTGSETPYVTITVKTASKYEGATLTFKNGEVITETVKNQTCSVTVTKTGTWTITNSVDSQTLSCTVSLEYSLSLKPNPTRFVLCSAEDFARKLYNLCSGKSSPDVIFSSAAAPASAEIIDVSDDGNEGVVMWYDSSQNKVYVSTQRSSQRVNITEVNYTPPRSIGLSMFGVIGYQQAASIGKVDFQNANFSGVTNLNDMFICSTLTSVDFSNCTGLTSGTLTSMYEMFRQCTNLRTVKFGGKVNTANVTNIEKMFDTTSITSIDINTLNFGNVTDMYGTFQYANIDFLKNTTLSITKVEALDSTFSYATYSGDLDLRWIDTRNVTRMSGTFSGCTANNLDISSWVTSKVENTMVLFSSCNFTSIHMDNFTVEKVTSFGHPFNCATVKYIYCKNDWTTNTVVKNADYGVFMDCTVLANTHGYDNQYYTTGEFCKPISSGGYFSTPSGGREPSPSVQPT